MDYFDESKLPISHEVVIRTDDEGAAIAGVVAKVDPATETVIFTDGRAYRFPEKPAREGVKP